MPHNAAILSLLKKLYMNKLNAKRDSPKIQKNRKVIKALVLVTTLKERIRVERAEMMVTRMK